MTECNRINWTEADAARSAIWHSENKTPAPRRVVIADDTLKADVAYRLACEGTALLWHGDFQNARQLLQALSRRISRPPHKRKQKTEPATPAEIFNLHRQAQSLRARVLAMLLIPLNQDYTIPLRRAPDIRAACAEAYGASKGAAVVSLRELLGLVGAHEWRLKGVAVPALGERVHPYYGVFSPVRGEYADLVANAPLPRGDTAFDIGTGTGVLAAILARRGMRRVVATDLDPRAVACAGENIARLGLSAQVSVVEADLYPTGRAALIVCNPPWIPARPAAAIEYAIYDPDSRMLHRFLQGLPDHLEPDGEGWLILSDLAEHLGLRSRQELLAMIDTAGLKILGSAEIKPRHPKSADATDPLHFARAAEVTSLWRLTAA
ncbi:MAG TPA: class I SAM-dependent methyltransferase [Burkholderiales bacterium]|nr:class I SAM-dependent methyltransferase [Burkholderiales bacterium]